MKIIELKCTHCSTRNLIAQCSNCNRYFVLVNDHLDNKVEVYESKPIELSKIPPDFSRWCDFCIERKAKHLVNAVDCGLRQRTCPNCHIEFLADYGL
jgi:hypothetical protein